MHMKEVMPPNANTPPVSLKLHIDRGIDVALNIIIIGLLMTAQLSFDLPRKLPLIEQQLQVQVEGPLIVESSLVPMIMIKEFSRVLSNWKTVYCGD